MTMDRLSREYPNITNNYLLELLGKFLLHFKETGDPKILRVNALRHGDKSLLTMLSAFVHHPDIERCNYLTMTKGQLDKLSIHRLLIAREMGVNNRMKKNDMSTALSTFYRERVTISGHRNPVYCVAFDKTNRRLFTGSDDFLVKVWCVRTGYLIHTIRGHQNIITDIAINQENTLVATASSDGCVRVWTMDEYKPIMCLRPNATTIKPFTTVKFSPSPRKETRYLMATNEDGIVRLWKWDRDTLQFFDIDSPISFSCKFRAKDRLRCSSFNYTGTKFTVAGDDGFVYVFSTIQVKTSQMEEKSSSGTANVGRGRKRIASALFPDKSGQTQIQPVLPIGILEGHMGSVTDLAYSHDGQRILSGSQDGTARIWKQDASTTEWSSIVLDIKLEHPPVTVVKPVTAKNDKKISGINTLIDDSDEIGSLVPFIEEEQVDDDIEINQEEVETNLATAPIDPPKVSMISWSADDRWCFIASSYGEIRVYYAYNGELACILKGHEGEIYALDNHPLDSSTILSAGYDGNVILWDVERQKVITRRHHTGRTFTDCKFSKDAMKYAITDEEGHCTLFSIGGLDKDYLQVRSWEKGQYFMSDYQALRHFADGTFLDEPTQQQPYLLAPSPIIDLQGVAYPNQKKVGHGRNMPTTSETFEYEDLKRSACYDEEEEEMLTCNTTIVLPNFDRATIGKRRREFVQCDDDDEADIAAANAIQLQFPPPPPLAPFLLPDDSADEDYHDDEDDNDVGNQNYASSASSDEEVGSDDFVARDDEVVLEQEDEEAGRVTRSRAGQTPTISLGARRTTTNNNIRRRGRGGGSATMATRGRGRPRSSTTRKRNRERSDDEEDQPVRARARRRVTERPSYAESDLEESEEESEEEEIEIEQEDPRLHEAGPSTSSSQRNKINPAIIDSSNIIQHESSNDQPEDRKGKRVLRSTGPSSDDHQPVINHAAASISNNSNRATRSRSSQQGGPAPVPPPTVKPSTKKVAKVRDGPRDLSPEEIKQHEPIPWITNTERLVTKYLPQMGDLVVILTEGHKQYLRKSEMKYFFDDKYGVLDKHEPILFAKITGISWHVGPPVYCKLRLAMMELVNTIQVIMGREQPIWNTLKKPTEYIEYTDEDGCPEFIILWQRFLRGMNYFQTLQQNQKVDAMYDEGPYTGTINGFNNQRTNMVWKQANLPSPWAFYHVIWDDVSSTPEDLGPWELVPTGVDFVSTYLSVEPCLTPQQIKRAKDILDWLSTSEDFYLYVHQVNYYDYPPYLSLIAYPICIDMIQQRLNKNFYRSIDGLLDDVELIKKNAMKYNADTSPAHKNAIRLANFFKTRLLKPSMPLGWSRGGGRKKVVLEESDDEYDNAAGEESEEEPILPKKSSRDDYPSEEDEDDFVNDDDEEDDYYE